MLEKTIEITLLFDYYGELLTDRQQESIHLYYFQDLSLGEIADQLEISRQGVYDHLNRGEELLYNYEKKLGLVRRYNKLKQELDDFIRYINNKNLNEDDRKSLINRIEQMKKQL